MIRPFKYSIVSFLLCFAFTLNAQVKDCSIKEVSFQSGELLRYKIYYNWHAIWVNAGEVSFDVSTENFLGKSCFYVNSVGSTYKKYDWIYKVRDRYEVWMDKSTLKPYRFKREVNEGRSYIYNDYFFFPKKSLVQTVTKIDDEPVKKDSASIGKCTYDVLSMIYYARCIDYSNVNVGDTIPISLFLDDKEYPSYIRYLGKEDIKTKEKKVYKCIKFKPLLIEGTIFKGGEDMTVWVTDDKNKIPVYIETPILVGSIKVSLLEYQNTKYPVECEILKE